MFGVLSSSLDFSVQGYVEDKPESIYNSYLYSELTHLYVISRKELNEWVSEVTIS